MVVEQEAVNTHVNASKEGNIGIATEKGATPVNIEEQEQAAIEADESTSSIKTGEGKTAHNFVDQEASAQCTTKKALP